MTSYIIRVALHEEANQGWVWMDGFASRKLVKITNPKSKRHVFCQVRKFDENFLTKYNNRPTTICIPKEPNDRKPTIVMGQWYRDALGGFDSTKEDNKDSTKKDNKTGEPQELDVKKVSCWCLPWATLRAAAGHHPDIVVRLGTRLGLLGAFLGILGLWSSLVGLFDVDTCGKWIIAGIIGMIGILAVCVCWPPKAPEGKTNLG